LLRAYFPDRKHIISHLPVLIAFVAVIAGGIFLLDRADHQARDTIRKHHLDDIEQALYVARNNHGTYPPYNQPTWCGELDNPANADVAAQVEAALRQQHDLYANPDKPFPRDPLADQSRNKTRQARADHPSYFYWKHSPALFELYANLEIKQANQFSTANCANAITSQYNYGLNSVLREGRTHSIL